MADFDPDWSGSDEDWLDDFPLAILRLIDGPDRLEDAETDAETSDDEDDAPLATMTATANVVTDAGRRWVRVPSGLNKTPPIPAFDDSNVGMSPNVDHEATTTVLDYFYLFFTTSFIGQLVARTNEYAAKVRAAKPEKNKMKWAPLDSGTLKKFIGLTLLMGVIKKPRIKDYWSTKPPLATPYFNWTMPRDRFTTILR